MQPYFLPYLGYFSLIANCDRFILLDTVQFRRHGWIERNRILKPADGWQYVRVPLRSHSRETAIRDIRIGDKGEWRKRIIAQLDHYRKKAPNCHEVMSWLESSLWLETDSIVKLDRHILRSACDRLGIYTPIEVFSEMGLEIEPPLAPDEWALNICKALGDVTEYWNPSGGMSFFDRPKFTSSAIKLSFLSQRQAQYDQKRGEFVPDLSIVDVMMFNGVKSIRTLLDSYDLF